MSERFHPKVLVVEDHQPTRTFLADNLDADGYEIFEAGTLQAARRQLERNCTDMLLLDLGLPDGDGLELIRGVRAGDVHARVDPNLPVLVLSGRSSELQRLRGFTSGADDYVVKPFSYPEIRARLDALMRRARAAPGGGRVRVGPLEIDAVARQVWLDGAPVALSVKEFALLRMLASDPARAFTREELLRTVWGYQAGTTRTLDSHASRLRRKLQRAGAKYVVNVWGVGYRLLDAGAV